MFSQTLIANTITANLFFTLAAVLLSLLLLLHLMAMWHTQWSWKHCTRRSQELRSLQPSPSLRP